jgi:hypothetical protein
MEQTLIDRLCLRRLCLPSFTNIEDLRSGSVKTKRISQIECGCSYHIACTFEGRYCFQSVELWDKYV